MSHNIKKTLLNIRLLRLHLRKLTIKQLEEALGIMTVVVEEARNKEKSELSKQHNKEAQIYAIANKIEQEGIELSALIDVLTKHNVRRRTPRPPKFKYIDKSGAEKTWTGQGRTPNPIREQLEQGRSLSEFLIE